MTEAPVVVAAAQVPADPAAAVTIDFRVHALRVAVVTREHVLRLSQDWSVPGVYVLLGALGTSDPTLAYVGKATKLRHRLGNHAVRKPGWWRAVAIQRDTRHGFNSAEIGYLEGRLAGELDGLPGVTLDATRTDLDTTLPEHERVHLDSFLPTIFAALRIVGLDTRPEAEHPQAESDHPTARRTYQGTVADLVAAGLLSSGAELVFRRAGKEARARVTASGELLVNGKSYASPSTAAAVALDLKAANGWISWRLDQGHGPTLADLRSELPTSNDGAAD